MRTQHGFSLVEIMVAGTIGLVILAGVADFFSSMGSTFKAQQNLAALQYSQRMATLFVNNAIRNAGAYPTITTTVVGSVTTTASATTIINGITVPTTAINQFPAVATTAATFAEGQSLTGGGSGALTGVAAALTGTLAGACTTTNGADTFSVRFVAGSNTNQGCSAALISGHVYVDTFQISTLTVNNTPVNVLQCVESDTGTPTQQSALVTTTVNLISGVTGMNLLYGVDTIGRGSVTQYLTADTVTTMNLWARVKTIFVTLQLTDPLPNGPPLLCATQTIPYTIGLYTATTQ